MPELNEAKKRKKRSVRESSERRALRPRSPGAHPIDIDEARLLLLPILGSSRRALLAVSGGPDSVALMQLCALSVTTGRLAHIEVATVDHGLRENSRAEAEVVGAWACDCGFSHALLSWEGQKPSARIQERARAARYALLNARMREIGATLLVTAHTLDDQAETVLMRMARGTGITGLAGMRPLSKRDGWFHARPFLSIPKARLLATCRANGWPFLEDPSNENSRFARARWRKLAPVLAQEGLTAERLAKLAERAASVEEALEVRAETAFATACIEESQDELVLDLEQMLVGEQRETALRLLMRGVKAAGGLAASTPLRLERAETLLEALSDAFSARKALKRTLGGAVLEYDGAERLLLRREGKRRRGRERAESLKPAMPARNRRPSPANKGNSIAPSVLV
ncbi:MAG: tRNA lysidine(34) synthetase TilS [Hyphomicrobiales bacterium]|nr:tRNA lysidine(34) synthetase TilS [Hyphomicrobiales bacterium]